MNHSFSVDASHRKGDSASLACCFGGPLRESFVPAFERGGISVRDLVGQWKMAGADRHLGFFLAWGKRPASGYRW